MASPTRRSGRWLRRLRRAAYVLGPLLVLGAVYQQVAQARDSRNHPPAGILADADGVRLHLHCEGAGSPTVVAEAGGGDFSIVWRHVQRDLAPLTRFCSYDRAGLGWSDYSSVIPTSQPVSTHLRSALASAGVEGPFVLVGHSLGGIYVRDFARRYPEDVVGMVLVDSSHENQSLRASPERRRQQDRSFAFLRGLMRVCHAASLTGIVRTSRFWHLVSSGMADEGRLAYTVTRNRTQFCSTLRQEVVALDVVMTQPDPPASLGDLPLIVLQHGRSSADTPAGKQWEETWSTLQAELAGLSTRSTHRVVEGAGHMIQIDRPDAVADAVREMVELIRG